MAVSARPYRFPTLSEEDEPARRRSAGSPRPSSCGACGASAVANCVALCCCPCAVVSCFTLALVKAPYVAGRRWVRLRLANAKTRRTRRGAALRNRKRVRSLEEEDKQAAEGLAVARASKEWCELGRPRPAAASGWWGSYGNTRDHEAIVSVVGEGRLRVSATEEAWMEMYEVGNWGFGRLSFSVAGDEATQEQVTRGDTEKKDGSVAAGP